MIIYKRNKRRQQEREREKKEGNTHINIIIWAVQLMENPIIILRLSNRKKKNKKIV